MSLYQEILYAPAESPRLLLNVGDGRRFKEIDILEQLKAPRTLRLRNVFESRGYIVTVSEGEVFSFVRPTKRSLNVRSVVRS